MTRARLYRHFDGEGNLLYVGVSMNAIVRLSQHSQKAPWFDQIRRIEIDVFADRKAARSAETEAIKSENPIHNIACTPKAAIGRAKPGPPKKLSYEAIAAAELLYHDVTIPIRKVAREVGVSPSTLRRLFGERGTPPGRRKKQEVSA